MGGMGGVGAVGSWLLSRAGGWGGIS